MKLVVAILSILTLGLTACKQTVKTENGQIPAEYLEEARQYTGSFVGQFNNEQVQMNLSLSGSKAHLEFDKNSNGLLVNNCRVNPRSRSNPYMSIGDLKYLTIDDKSKARVFALTFKLNHNCSNIQGNEVILTPSEDLNYYNIYITKAYWVAEFCHEDEYIERPRSNNFIIDIPRVEVPRVNTPTVPSSNSRLPRIPETDFPDYKHCFTYVKGQVKR